MADLRAFFLLRRRNLERECLSQMKLVADKAPPTKTNNPVCASKSRRAKRAKARERMIISLGIRWSIFSPSESMSIIALIKKDCPFFLTLEIFELTQSSYEAIKARSYTQKHENQQQPRMGSQEFIKQIPEEQSHSGRGRQHESQRT